MKHQHFITINSPDDSVVVELSVQSQYRDEEIMQILKEAEDNIKEIFTSQLKKDGDNLNERT